MSENSICKTIKDLNLLDSFLFSELTENPENAKLIARIIIKRVFGWQADNIEVESEKQYHGYRIGQKGIRLDLQVTERDDKKIIRFYDIEPNQYIEKFLAKRGRYYLSLTDAKLLGTSKKYKELPEYFSVWILPYDPFGDNRIVYTVKNMVVENPQLVYNDGVTRIYLYTDGEIGGNDELRALLRYFVQTQECNAVDEELQELQSVVSDIKNDEEVGERYMTIEEVIEYEKDDSYEKGHSDGMSAGISTGIDGCIRACRKFGKSDAEIIEVLMEEYALSHEEAEQKVNNL